MKTSILVFILVCLFATHSEAQLFRKKKPAGEDYTRHGKYTEYWDEDNKNLSVKGYFCRGVACKTWKYFYEDGTLRMKVKYHDQLKLKYFMSSGQLSKKGHAILSKDSKYIHFYWTGRWKYYDDKRKLYRVAIFENGDEVSVLLGPEDAIYYE